MAIGISLINFGVAGIVPIIDNLAFNMKYIV